MSAAAQQGTEPHGHHTAPWYATLWLTGVDYFSSLGYAPGLAIAAGTGRIGASAMVLLHRRLPCA